MLNYIWLTLIVVGIVVAVGYDVKDLSQDTYRNGKEIHLRLSISKKRLLNRHVEFRTEARINPKELSEFYGIDFPSTIFFKDELFPAILIMADTTRGRLSLDVSRTSFARWKEMAKFQGNEQQLRGSIRIVGETGNELTVLFQTDPIRFVTLNKVSNDGIFRYAKIAVELAIGLIGIMALWLGVMHIAEQSGLIAKIAVLVKPVMTRLFPDVPADHPAMGAMIMNISANMLGLANAATPLGLKAMEELNKFNKKLGTATDAMCTFLVINTSNVQLIPATVIAIRAAAGSANPTEIIGPAIVATTISTVVGVIVVKLLAKMKFYKDQLRAESIEI